MTASHPPDCFLQEPLHEVLAYKSTKISDIVCLRRCRLFSNRLVTIHPNNTNEKCWYLAGSCTLSPQYQDELLPEKRSVRPEGSWSVTTKAAALAGGGNPPVELYCVTIHWPTSWLATRGYTSFTLGFETVEEAAQWHWRVQKQISQLRMRNASNKGDASVGHSSKPSYDDRSLQWSNGGTTIMRKPSQDKGIFASALEHWLGSREDKPAAQEDAGGGQAQPYRMPTSPVQIPIPSRPSSAPTTLEDGEYGDDKAYGQCEVGGRASSNGSCQCFPAALQEEQRWVPYRHTNGVAIYHQKESKCSGVWAGDEAGEGVGSEYMASCIVRGSPDECLEVLMDLSSNTTILGPASKIELLEDGEERQVLRMTVEATGMARRLCAPREVTVERLFQREECGVDVILFSSCDPPPVSPRTRRRNGLNASATSFSSLAAACSTSAGGSSLLARLNPRVAVGCAAAGAGIAAVAGIAAAAGCSPGLLAATGICTLAALAAAAAVLLLLLTCLSSWQHAVAGGCSGTAAPAGGTGRGWRDWLANVAAGGAVMWYRPVQAFVQGGYTISPREDCNGSYSPECLVTCILKVELGGWLGERSWMRPFADALGWVDAYIERMLMAVILVKDEVEQRKFLVQPFSILTSTSRTALAMKESSAAGTMYGAAGMEYPTSDGGMGQQQWNGHQLRQRSKRWQQDLARMPEEPSPRWQLQQQSNVLGQQAAAAYAAAQQSLQHQRMTALGAGAEQELNFKGSVCDSADLARKSSQSKGAGQKQKGALGRMASRIYALRPRLLRGNSSNDSVEPPAAAASPLTSTGLYRESISFNSQIAARTADGASPAAGNDDFSGSIRVPAGATAGATAGAGTGAAAGGEVLDVSDPKLLLASLGMPEDTAVVPPEYYMGGPQGAAARGTTLNSKFWQELHTPGTPAPFKLRGASYLEDRQKMDGGMPQFVLSSVDLVETPGPTQHISRFLPQVRLNQAAYSLVVNLIIPGTPMLSLVAVFINEHHPDVLDPPRNSGSSSSRHLGAFEAQLAADMETDVCSTSGMSSSSNQAPSSSGPVGAKSTRSSTRRAASGLSTDLAGGPGAAAAGGSSSSLANGRDEAATVSYTVEGEGLSEAAAGYERPADTSDWQPFDYALHRFLHGDEATRTAMFKLIPHIAEGSWVIKQSVGTVPVILGNKIKTVYYQTDRYIEACCDVTSSSAAAYITGMVRGATKSLVIDLGFVLEGQRSEELPEALLGAFRLNYLDCTAAKKIDTSRELPLLPRPLQHCQLVALQQQAQQQLAAAAAGGDTAPGAGVSAVAAAGGSDTQGTTSKAAAAAAANGDEQAAAQRAVSGHEPLAQQDRAQLQAVLQHLQQRCRNSLSILEGSRTMTGHARSRSAASVDELMSTCGSPRTGGSASKEHQRPKPSCSFSSPKPQQQPQQQVVLQQTPRSSQSASGLIPSGAHVPASIRTNMAGAAASASSETAAKDSGERSSSFVGVTPAKQLFSSLLSFSTGGVDRGSGGKGSAAAAANCDSAAVPGVAAPAGVANSSQPQAYGAVSSLSSAATPAENNTPNAAAAAAAAAGSLLGTVNSVGSVGAFSGHSVATPTAAPSAAVGLRGHHRTSSNSECKTPGAAGGAAAPGWPASPPTGSVEWSNKLSAAAYISRAHAAALAASAQRRSGQRGSHQQTVGSPSSYNSMAEPAAAAAAGGGGAGGGAGSGGSASAACLSASPGVTAGLTTGLDEADAGTAGGWHAKRPRTSSSGSAVIHEHQHHHHHYHASLEQQLRLTKQPQQPQQQQQQSGSGLRPTWGSGNHTHHHASSGSGSGLSVLASIAGARQASMPGLGPGEPRDASIIAAGGAAAAPSSLSGSPPQQQPTRKFSHRRFASLPINSSSVQ